MIKNQSDINYASLISDFIIIDLNDITSRKVLGFSRGNGIQLFTLPEEVVFYRLILMNLSL